MSQVMVLTSFTVRSSLLKQCRSLEKKSTYKQTKQTCGEVPAKKQTNKVTNKTALSVRLLAELQPFTTRSSPATD